MKILGLSDIKEWYTKRQGKFLIELKVHSIEQLYDKRDPNPFREKDLDDDVFDYVLTSANDIGPKHLGGIDIYVTHEFSDQDITNVSFAFKDFFEYHSVLVEKKLKSKLITGLKSFVIGFLFLFISSYLSKNIDSLIMGPSKDYIKELALVLGWVSMWMPLNIFLYEWWPLVGQRKVLVKLSNAPVNLRKFLL